MLEPIKCTSKYSYGIYYIIHMVYIIVYIMIEPMECTSENGCGIYNSIGLHMLGGPKECTSGN